MYLLLDKREGEIRERAVEKRTGLDLTGWLTASCADWYDRPVEPVGLLFVVSEEAGEKSQGTEDERSRDINLTKVLGLGSWIHRFTNCYVAEESASVVSCALFLHLVHCLLVSHCVLITTEGTKREKNFRSRRIFLLQQIAFDWFIQRNQRGTIEICHFLLKGDMGMPQDWDRKGTQRKSTWKWKKWNN